MARLFSDPLGSYTPLVITLWYRSPELLLGEHTYSTEVDMWFVFFIFKSFTLGVLVV
jgi:cell division cycle 2-like